MAGIEDTFGSSVNARMAHASERGRAPVDDLERAPTPEAPPVPGAQWDEVHRRWEVWDEAAGVWRVHGDDGDGVAPERENLLPAFLAREVLHAEELEKTHEVVLDVPRRSPTGPAPKGAQWNEISGRWERWDEAAGAWVEAPVVIDLDRADDAADAV